MKITIKRWTDGGTIWEGEADGIRSGVETAVIAKIDLAYARLDGARLDGARLVGARLDGASLAYARLVGARLDGAILDGASLAYARLVGASLDGAILVGAILDGAKYYCRLNMIDPRGYIPLAWLDEKKGLIIKSGCHTFVANKALAHWGAEDYPNRRYIDGQVVIDIGARYVAANYKKSPPCENPPKEESPA